MFSTYIKKKVQPKHLFALQGAILVATIVPVCIGVLQFYEKSYIVGSTMLLVGYMEAKLWGYAYFASLGSFIVANNSNQEKQNKEKGA